MTKQTEEALIEIIDEQIEWIDGWEKAYPESIFSPVTEKESEALEQYKKHLGMRIAAQMARHIGKRFKEVIKTLQSCKEALEQPSVAQLNDEYLRDTHVEGLSQPAQEPYDLVAILNDPMQAYPANFTTAKKGNALLFGLCQEAADEIQRLQHKTLEQPAQEPVALLEALSDLEHQQWMKWAQSIMDSEPISDARKQRWATMMVDYKDLPDNIQEYDREWARKVMALYTHPAPPCQECENLKHDLEGYMEANKALINREWVNLTDGDIQEHLSDELVTLHGWSFVQGVRWANKKLKEKNNVM